MTAFAGLQGLKKMTLKELNIFFTTITNDLFRFGKVVEFSDDVYKSIHDLESDEEKDLFMSLIQMHTQLNEAQKLTSQLSNGQLDIAFPSGNSWFSPLKQLHANLLHLVWQVQRLAEGDLDQKIDFLGDFSIYFNRLIHSLKEKREIENELKNNAEKYRISIENANIGIMTVDLAGNIVMTNKECFNIFGYSQAEFENMPISRFTAPEDLKISPEFISSALNNPNQSKGEFIKRYFHKSGELVTCQVSSSLMYNDKKEPLFFISHIKDISSQVKTAHELTELNSKLSETISELKEANKSKDKFFKIIAHDLKNPFNAILGFSDMLMENIYTDSPDEIEKQAAIIHQSSLNAYKLLENLLEWSMSQTGMIVFNPSIILIEGMLKEVLKLNQSLAEINQIRISYSISGCESVYADADMLSTILRNLVGNAIKFTKPGGSVSIEVVSHDQETLFSVTDTGIGIAEEFIDQLFIRGERGAIPVDAIKKGTGLGLMLCKEFVEKHHGKIWVKSKPGEGSIFKFTIPATPSRTKKPVLKETEQTL